MNLDGKELGINAEVYHLTLGYGRITLAMDGGAVAKFGSGQELGFNSKGQVNSNEPSAPKVIGLRPPLIVWGESDQDPMKLREMVMAGIALMGTK